MFLDSIAAPVAAAGLLGFRHGVDYDHIAAIADLTGSARRPAHAIGLAIMYGLGHAAVVVALGALSVWFGMVLPKGSDQILEGAVGCTLVVLGAYVLSSLFRSPATARPMTRFELLRRIGTWLRSLIAGSSSPHEHTPSDLPPSARAAFSVGIIHGIGAETPTQLGLFVLSAGIGGWIGGFICVLTFAVGLLAMNTLMALASAGMFHLSNLRESIYRGVILVTGAYSIAIGVLFILGSTGLTRFA